MVLRGGVRHDQRQQTAWQSRRERADNAGFSCEIRSKREHAPSQAAKQWVHDPRGPGRLVKILNLSAEDLVAIFLPNYSLEGGTGQVNITQMLEQKADEVRAMERKKPSSQRSSWRSLVAAWCLPIAC